MPTEILDKREETILELETRKKIYEIVKKNAGCHFREIERRCGLATGTVQYHLGYLARHKMIGEEKENNTVRYFSKELNTKNKRLLSILRQKSMRHILLFIFTNNNCNQEQIVKEVQLSPSTVSWHIKKLEEEGVISSRKEGRKTFYENVIDKEEISALLITYQESFFDNLVDNVVEMWEME